MNTKKTYATVIAMILLQISAHACGMTADTRTVQDIFNEAVTKEKEFQCRLSEDGWPTEYSNIDGYQKKFITPENIPVFQATIVNYLQKTRPLFSLQTVTRSQNFLQSKREKGSDIEKELYTNMTIEEFMVRLVVNRPPTCFGRYDKCVYFDRKANKYRQLHQGLETLKKVGTPEQKENFTLQDILSVEEREISSAIHISGPTFFINRAQRNNEGTVDSNQHEANGIAVGIVGTCYEKMEYLDCNYLYSEKDKQDGDILITTENIYRAPNRDLNKGILGYYFRPEDYKDRVRSFASLMLEEANKRGKSAGKKTYVHIMGAGLGAWSAFDFKVENIQIVLSLEVYKELLENNTYEWISDVNFSWFDVDGKARVKASLQHEQTINNIKILFTQRATGEKLIDQDEGKLLVAMYGWDNFSFPGNEYFLGGIGGTSDPDTAAGTLISSLQNPLINEFVALNAIKRTQKLLKQKQDSSPKNIGQRQQDEMNKINSEPSAIPSPKLEPQNPSTLQDQQSEKANESEKQDNGITEKSVTDTHIGENKHTTGNAPLVESDGEESPAPESIDLPKKKKTTNIQRFFSNRTVQFTGILAFLAVVCYSNKDAITSLFTNYLEKFNNYTSTTSPQCNT